ncbi:SusC/RagA family TonB-linked outer membrane protein [Pedobacter petrophilus]|uniref:SusC/RagA family TonB-linked outer membrane protein n=1 Tax=Pedobacter petrophilus TaxID=1908241 RepID=A0A7K0FXH3_9SPHI|nr:SusC/RagA family TonB-linked outer membrane protein [Pedobacter petrophilus]MRX75754.1 SusC/RagA family TonB-linked outer membrane protein [Pedobacter petrophilus]
MYKKYLTWKFRVHILPVKPAIEPSQKTGKFKLPSLLLFTLLLLQLQSFAQSISEKKISIAFTNYSLEQIIADLELQTKVKFVYNEALINKGKKINGNFQTETFSTVLEKILRQYEISYEMVDNKFVILKSNPARQSQPTSNAKAEGVAERGFLQSGIVLDEIGKPLPGVSVHLNNATNIAFTDSKGIYQIGIPNSATLILFTYIGYKNKSVLASNGQQIVSRLEPDPGRLDEVNVIGYGTASRRTSTGSDMGITAKELERTPASNPAAALQGRVAGVYITQGNGSPGAPMVFTIRGTNSIAGRNNPLFIVDGVPYLAEAVNAQTGNSLDAANGSTSPLNSINPADIESINILKDADATAIYGSRGANGVVLITTKKGKAGKTTLDGIVKHGVSEVSHFVNTLNVQDYLAIRRQAYVNTGVNPIDDSAFDLTRWDQGAQTDFQKLLIGNTANMTEANLALGGGDERTNFRISGTHWRQGNVFTKDQGYKRTAANLNVGHLSLDRKFEVNISAIYSAEQNNISVLDLTSAAYNLPPNYPLYNPDGSLYWSGVAFGIPVNPLGQLRQLQDNKTNTLLTNMVLNYHILEGLSFKTSLGFSRSDMDQSRINPMSSMDPGVSTNESSSMFVNNNTTNYIIEPQLNYNRNILKGKLTTMIGGTWQSQNSNQPYYTLARGFASDAFLTDLASANTVSVSSSSSQYKYASVFARVNYNWESKYIVNLNFRRDGSSRFGPNSRYGNFGSVGAAWIFTEEKFAKELSVLSFGKLRGSYGIVGSDQIGDYQYLDSYVSVPYQYNGINGLTPVRIANDAYRWEETKKLEVAIDLGFFKDRISLTAAYYRNVTGNQLVSFPLSIQAGFSSYQGNLPATVENKGLEITLSSQNIKSKDFSWSTNINFSVNSNKLLSFPNIENTSYYSRYLVGRPLTSNLVYQYTGMDPTTGLPTVADLNGNGSINVGFLETGRGDRYFAGSSQPKFYGGVSNTLSYKGITVDFLFQFVKQTARTILSESFFPPGFMNNAASGPILEYVNSGLSNQPQITSNFDNAYDAYSNYTSSDAIYKDASFIRLKNASVSYDFRGKWLKRLKLQNLRFQLQGQNLFTITNYEGFDPEFRGLNLPPLRTIVGVLQFTF